MAISVAVISAGIPIFSDGVSSKAFANSEIPVGNVSFDQAEINLRTCASMPLTVTVTPIDATVKDVCWNSSDETVAKVKIINNRPTIVAIKPGEATITVKTVDGGKIATAKVYVANAIDVSGDGLLTKDDLKIILKTKIVVKETSGGNTHKKQQLHQYQ